MSEQEVFKRPELEAQLRELDQQLRSEMIARGFDPTQGDNVALTAPLAKLYMQREKLRAELDSHDGASLTERSGGMTEIQRIMDQLNRAFEGEAWHGPAVMEVLEGITPQGAASRPSNTMHSIWEIALHIAAWVNACRRRLGGERAQLSEAEDWPPVPDANEQSWAQTKEAVRQAYKELGNAISKLDESRLGEPILEAMPSIYVTLHGAIQHSLYHAGQIALLKKACEQERV